MSELGEQKCVWQWEQPNPRVSGSSGDLAKLFRNEGVKHPGLLAAGAPSATATVMAREVIQNSWDAANDLRSQLEKVGEPFPEFEITFRYRNLEGAEKAQLVTNLDLAALSGHVTPGNRRALGLADSDCLDHLNDDVPLRVLQIEERGASGMYGPFEGAKSKLYLALISLGYTVKHEGAGGSFGFGKAGLIRGSAIRSLLAYTCFREKDDDLGITTRLLGMTYWGQHDLNGQAYNGFARFGNSIDDYTIPFENEAADEMAGRFGISTRSSNNADELGSTFLLLDPVVQAEELCTAIARNWWPALMDRAFVARVVTAEGEELVPRPKRDPVLERFLRGYELAVTPQDNSALSEYSKDLGKTTATGAALSIGSIGLVADLEGWSYPNEVAVEAEDDVLSHRSLVALVRGPRMVVEYLEVGQRVPFVRGAFVASEEIDDLLRQSEPMAHDAWQTDAGEEGIDPASPKVAAAVLRKSREAVADFRKRLRPPVPREEDIRLPLLQDLFRKLLDGAAPGPPSPPPLGEKRLISIRVKQELEPAETVGMVRAAATVGYALSPNFDGEAANVALTIEYRFVEDGRSGEQCAVDVVAPQGFTRTTDAGKFVGRLTREPVDFQLTTHAYSGEWTGRLVATSEILEVVAAQNAASELGDAQ